MSFLGSFRRAGPLVGQARMEEKQVGQVAGFVGGECRLHSWFGAPVAAATAGIRHVVRALPRPYPDSAARWLVDEIVTPVRENGA